MFIFPKIHLVAYPSIVIKANWQHLYVAFGLMETSFAPGASIFAIAQHQLFSTIWTYQKSHYIFH
jgi:hypothetical protein